MARLGSKAADAAKSSKPKKAPKTDGPADKGTMFYTEKLSDAQVLAAGREHALKEHELRKLEAAWKDHVSGHRGKVKTLKGRIEELSDQVHTGERKVPAQKALPLEERE